MDTRLSTHGRRCSAIFGLARADGSFRTLLARLSRVYVLVSGDWAMAPLSEPERRDFWGACEDRHQVRSRILTSQLTSRSSENPAFKRGDQYRQR